MGISDSSAADRCTAGTFRFYRRWHGERTISANGASLHDRLHGAATLAAVMPMESETCRFWRALSVNLSPSRVSRPIGRALIASVGGSIPAKMRKLDHLKRVGCISHARHPKNVSRKRIWKAPGVEAAVSAAFPGSAVSAAYPPSRPPSFIVCVRRLPLIRGAWHRRLSREKLGLRSARSPRNVGPPK